MRFIILFPIFIHIVTPTLILLFVITSSYFVITSIPTLILLLHPCNNGLSIMEMFKLIMVDPAILLSFKMS
jgi:hypothetical protein